MDNHKDNYLNKEYFKHFFDKSGNPVSYILEEKKRRQDISEYLAKTKEFITYKKIEIKKSNYKIYNKVTTSQLRNVFALIQKRSKHEVTDKMLSELEMQRIKLAYIAGRTDEKSMQQLCALLDALIQNVNKENYNRFIDFFEALIAYDKYAEKIK